MEASNNLIEAIKSFEGVKLTSYRCPAGIWTIGVGHIRGVKQGQTISLAQAESLLKGDLLPCVTFVNNLHLNLTQGQFDALVDFAFNLGTTKLASSTLLKYIKAKKPAAEIQAQFTKWIYAGGKVLEGLKKRRQWEAAQWVR